MSPRYSLQFIIPNEQLVSIDSFRRSIRIQGASSGDMFPGDMCPGVHAALSPVSIQTQRLRCVRYVRCVNENRKKS